MPPKPQNQGEIEMERSAAHVTTCPCVSVSQDCMYDVLVYTVAAGTGAGGPENGFHQNDRKSHRITTRASELPRGHKAQAVYRER